MKTSIKSRWYLLPFLCLMLMSGVVLMGCSTAAEVPDEVAEDIMTIVRWNLNYATDENLDGYMWTIHQDSPAYGQTRSLMRTAMDDFDLLYHLVESELISYSGDTAKVRVVQLTRSRGPAPDFRDNQLEAVHTLRMTEEGDWKIYSSSFTNVEYLEP